jgi:hypothetical protein
VEKLQWEKNPRPVKQICLNIGSLIVWLTQNSERRLKLEIQRLICDVLFNYDDSGVKEIELHKIAVSDNNGKILAPLAREEFHETNVMFNFRVKDRFVRGLDSATWQIFEHLEVLVHPLDISAS